jgi:hypothetical protein
VRLRRFAGEGRLSRRQCGRHVGGSCQSAAYSKQRRHDPAHHLPQERVADHLDGDQLPPTSHGQPMQRPHRLAIVPTEGREVVPADEYTRCGRHGRHVETPAHSESVPLAQRASWPIPDQVAVLAIPGPVPRPEVRRDRAQRPEADVRREQGLESSLELASAESAHVGEGNHLAAGVDTGVRPSGTLDLDPPATG